MYANHKKLPLEHVEVSLFHDRNYLEDADHAAEKGSQIEALVRKVQLVGALTEEQKVRLMEIADRCPVHRTLHNNPKVVTHLIEE
jgi:putative redox protein